MDEPFIDSPWFAVTLGILGLVVGYSLVIFQSDVEAKRYCPAKAAAEAAFEQHS